MLLETEARSHYWSEHFCRLAVEEGNSEKKLDFSNERVMIQNFAFILETLGDVAGKQVLDCGCGSGALARLIADLGAQVHAFDFVEQTITDLRRKMPDIEWSVADLAVWAKRGVTNTYDIVVASEVLEYVAFESTTRALHAALRPGGRLIITIPNSECRIVRRASQRFNGQYAGTGLATIQQTIERCVPGSQFIWRGIRFLEDQSLFPYTATPWCDPRLRRDSENINRIQIVIARSLDG